MDAIEAMHGRRSIRAYQPRPVPRALIDELLWAAVQAPTPPVSGEQAWSLTVVADADTLAGLGARALAFARDHTAAEWPRRPGFQVFWGAPVLVLINARLGNPEAPLDCCRAGQNLLLAAHARGLGACWVGAPLPWLASPGVAGEIGIEDGYAPSVAIVLGWAAETPAGQPRAKPFVHWRDGAREALHALLRTMPKAELHIHIEGSLEPELIFALAARNGVALPYAGVEALRAAYAFTDLQSFLDIYYAGASVLLREDDFFDMAWAYFQRAAADHVVRAEIFFDPQTHTARGVDIGVVIGGLHRACERAQAELGISAALILCFLRHLSEDEAFATLDAALPHRDRFIGVGLDSGERGNPPEKFARVFARCRDLGLHAVAHAGEEGPPAYIEAALDLLQVERIDHGVRCVESPALVQRLAASRMPLTVCPLSNVKLCVFDAMDRHNLKDLLDAGLAVTINSDDPAYFGGYVVDNYIAAFDALPALGLRDAWRLAQNGIDASFASAPQKSDWTARLLAAFAAVGAASSCH